MTDIEITQWMKTAKGRQRGGAGRGHPALYPLGVTVAFVHPLRH